MSNYSPEFTHVINKINTIIDQFLHIASAWWAISPNLIDTVKQYQERLGEARSFMSEAKILFSLLPTGDVKSYGINYSLEELRYKLLVHLDRVSSLMSEHQKR